MSEFVAVRPAYIGIKADGSQFVIADDDGQAIAPSFATDSSGNITGLVGQLGTAGFVDAGLFGASPSASAAINTAAIQAALDVGGRVTIIKPGVYQISKTLIMSSDTHLIIGRGVVLQLAENANTNILRNKSAGVLLPGASFVRASNIVTVAENSHPRAVGDWVLISGLLTDTSFNGLVQIVSVSTNGWTYASTGSNGSPTGYGSINPAFNQLAAANFSSSSNVVTVTETGHTREIGNPVYIANLAGNTSFNGTYQITSISGDTWSYIKTGADTAPTGTAIVLGDNNLSFTLDGAIDGNHANQSGINAYTNSSQPHGVVLGNAGTISRVGGRLLNQQKYTWWLFNVADVILEDTFFSTASDGNHFEAPADRIVVRNQMGSAADDLVAFTNVNVTLAGYPGLASPSGMGDFGSVVIDGLFPSNSESPAQVKYAGFTGYTFRSLTIRNVYGTLYSGGGAGFVMVDDTASLTGGSIENLEIDGVVLTGGAGSSTLLSISLTGSIGSIRINNVNLSNDFAGLVPFSINNATIKAIHFKGILANYTSFANLQLCNVYSGSVDAITCSDSSFSNTGNQGEMFMAQGTATLKRIMFSNIDCYAVSSLFKHNSGTVTTDSILAANVRMDAVANGLSLSSTGSIFVDNLIYTNGVNHLFQIAGGTVKIHAKNLSCAASKLMLLNYGGSSINYSCPDASAGLDLGANAGSPPTGLVPVAGDMIWNTNATGTGLYGYTAAGAWTKIF